MSNDSKILTVETSVNVPISTAWSFYTLPEHITQWNQASPDWCCPNAVVDLQAGGKFNYRMEAKDGSFGFDFGGIFDEILMHDRIMYTIEDGRRVTVLFASFGERTRITLHFEAENENPLELQQNGWQSILDSLKAYIESTQ